MTCPKCESKLKTITTRRINSRLTVRYRRCEKCRYKVKTTETY